MRSGTDKMLNAVQRPEAYREVVIDSDGAPIVLSVWDGREGDPLFPLAYTEQVFARIAAPSKELLVVDSDAHLLFNEALDAVLPPLLDRLTRRPANELLPA
jgi:hypothetical protein